MVITDFDQQVGQLGKWVGEMPSNHVPSVLT
jgi:hypothetical protein